MVNRGKAETDSRRDVWDDVWEVLSLVEGGISGERGGDEDGILCIYLVHELDWNLGVPSSLQSTKWSGWLVCLCVCMCVYAAPV